MIKPQSNLEWEEDRCPSPLLKKRTPWTYLLAGVWFLGYLIRREVRYYRKRPIDTLFFLTFRCTSRCKTCTLWQRTDGSGEMTLDEWKRAADMCAEQGAEFFEMFGGDALLRPEVLVPLVAHIASKPGLQCGLVTNGNLMTEEIARGLVEGGIDDIYFSLDGVEQSHNQVRGNDRSFDRMNRAIDWILAARGDRKRPLLHTNTTISNLNYDRFDEVLPYAEQKGFDFHHLEYAGEFWDELLDQSIIQGVRPNPYFVRQGGVSILVNEEQARIIKAKVVQMKKEVRRMRISLQCENVDKLTIKQMTSGECDNRRCYVTRGKITIDPRGNVVGCCFYGDWIMGNVREQHLRDIWNNDKHRQFMKHFAAGDMKICDRCILGVQRNPTPLQNIRDYVNRALGRARM